MSCPFEAALAEYWGAAPDPAHDMAHIARVWAGEQAIAAEEPAPDMELLRAACVFHDLVSLPKDAPNRAEASRLSAEAARPLARACGLPEDKLDAMAHAIEAHSFSAGIAPRTLEAEILQDADRLDALGAIGIARMFAVSGSLARPLYDPSDPLARSRPLDDTAFALDHFETKLLGLPETMRTRTGRRLAEERAAYMRAFLDRFMHEIEAG